MSKSTYEAAKDVGASDEQAAELARFLDGGQWNTTVNQTVTHIDGSRHWSTQPCQECKP